MLRQLYFENKMFFESIGQLRLFWHLWQHWKGFTTGTSCTIVIPQKNLTLYVIKKVLVSALRQLRINFMRIFQVFPKLPLSLWVHFGFYLEEHNLI